MAFTTRKVFDAYIDDEGNICYSTEDLYMGEYVIRPDFFCFTPTTPRMGVLEIFHLSHPSVLLVSFNMEHDYPEFEEDMAERVAFYIENYC